MSKENEINYNQKIDLCRKLGAKKFQDFVFKVENVKWKIVKKIIPNYIKIGDKFIEHNKKKRIKKAKNEYEIDQIKRVATMQKMLLRKEYNNSENINYHINTNEPSKFIKELNWNKNIHKRGLLLNGILLPLSIVGVAAGIPLALPLAIYETFSTFINFECVNVQNYNIYRLKKIEKQLIAKENKQIDKKIEQYHDAYELIGKKLEEKKDIIDINEVIDGIKSKEQLQQLKELIKKERELRKNSKSTEIKGGKKKW